MSRKKDKGVEYPRKAVLAAIRKNRELVQGILARRRVVTTEKGVLSRNGDRELFALLRREGTDGWWYGHVLRVYMDKEPQWAALIVNAMVEIDAPDEKTLFERVRYWLEGQLEYHPVRAQREDDTCAFRHSFEEAVEALVEMIRRFRINLREPGEKEDLGYEPEGQCDLRPWAVYGLDCNTNEDGVRPPIPYSGR
ncbi:MAG: hypothetical protein ACNS63_04305 [Candidatus Nitrospinota bacterium M3_3B_026]